MKVKINNKLHDADFTNNKNEIFIKIEDLENIEFFKEWWKITTSGTFSKKDYVKNIDFYSVTKNGTFYNAFPVSLDIDGKFILIVFDQYGTEITGMKMNNFYTRDEVEKLLEQQREFCYKKAKIKCAEYVNPYSNSDGEKDYYVTKESILNAKIDF